MIESALGWIGQAVEWFALWIPRRVIIEATHAGVKFKRGSHVVALAPGLHVFWPITTTLHVFPVVRQAVDLRAQTLVTRDDRSLAVGGLIVYEVTDIVALIGHTYDPDDTIRDIALSAIHDVCSRYTYAQLRDLNESGELARLMRGACRRGLKPYGVRVLKTTLTDFAPCRVHKLITSTSQAVGHVA
jgi:regulator of protease activity HflC (stomatin/prohibitin superfamily)